jgi:hypothetical protein
LTDEDFEKARKAQLEIRKAIQEAKRLAAIKRGENPDKDGLQVGNFKIDDRDKYGKDGRKLTPIESVVFHLLRNAESKYGLKKQTLYEKLMQHNPFGNLPAHTITSINMLNLIKDGLKNRVFEL